MELFKIRNRFSDEIVFKLETETIRICLEAAVKSGVDLQDADLQDADLQGADLQGAYLRGAYLRGAYLRGAYLRGADSKKIILSRTPLQILGMHWPIIIFDSHMKIGCEFHTIVDWKKYGNDVISHMNLKALEWWKKYKKTVINFCDVNGRV